MIRHDHKPWTPEEVARCIELYDGGKRTWPQVGKLVGRHGENCRRRAMAFMCEPPEAGSTAAEEEHIRACRDAGGFRSIPLPWTAPVRVWRAA